MQYREYIGKTYGRLTGLRKAGSRGKQTFWLFQCSCGRKKEINVYNVIRGAVKSCGCIHLERCRNGLVALKHGGARKGHVTRLHNTWRAMRGRCRNHNNNAYVDYGGRGISVCQEWDESYAVFRDWAEASGYSPKLTLDRIDNDGDYSPDNCQWATRKEQARNRRSTRLITFDDRTQTLAAWAEETGLGASTIFYRLGKLGWPVRAALTTPTNRRTTP